MATLVLAERSTRLFRSTAGRWYSPNAVPPSRDGFRMQMSMFYRARTSPAVLGMFRRICAQVGAHPLLKPALSSLSSRALTDIGNAAHLSLVAKLFSYHRPEELFEFNVTRTQLPC